MTAAAHTPGPWKFGVRRDGSIWLSLGDHDTGPHFQGDLVASEDDARLIVAAPDLLAALVACSTADGNEAYSNACHMARAAITKASGAAA